MRFYTGGNGGHQPRGGTADPRTHRVTLLPEHVPCGCPVPRSAGIDDPKQWQQSQPGHLPHPSIWGACPFCAERTPHHASNFPNVSGQSSGEVIRLATDGDEPLGRERNPFCFGVALVTIASTGPPLPGGVQVCQLSSRQPIILPSTGMGVCLTFARCNQFGSVPFGEVADLGSHPNGLTGCEVGCLIVECHEVGSFGSG